MKTPAVLQTQEGQWVVLGLIGLVVVYYISKKVLGAGVAAAGAAIGTTQGALTGNNALTAGTPYAGTGALGTVGAEADAISGGGLSSIGTALGGWLSDLTNPYDPNAPTSSAINRNQVVTPNYVTDLSQTTPVSDPTNFGTTGSGW